ncbi:MAG: T9SS type A sorting domain-containing protein [Bacteroidetes bacterium]|nr:T9SS type A sorting domain-containing protein [Bacteroidota bacterium]
MKVLKFNISINDNYVEVQSLKDGIYFLKIVDIKNVYSFKFIEN